MTGKDKDYATFGPGSCAPSPDVDDALAEAFMDGARCARENALEIAREGLTPGYLEAAGFRVIGS